MNDIIVYVFVAAALVIMVLCFTRIGRDMRESTRWLERFNKRLHRSKHEKWKERQCKVCKRWHTSPEAASLCSDWDRVGL